METSKIIKVPELSFLFPQPGNYEDIKADISQRGIKEPLVITPEGKLICGYTRLQIAKELGIKEVPVRTEPLNDILDMQEYAIRDNYHRRQLSRLQMVELCGQRLEEIERRRADQRMRKGRSDPMDTMTRGLTRDRVGEQIGMSGRTYQRWKIVSQKASLRTRQALETGVINLASALELCKLPVEEQDKLIERTKDLSNPHSINWLTIQAKVKQYARHDSDGFLKRSEEIKALDEEIPTLCFYCFYVRLYEDCEGEFSSRRDFRKFMYPLAAQIYADFRPDLFVDGAVPRGVDEGVEDWAEMFYILCKNWKKEKDHDCYEQKNVAIIPKLEDQPLLAFLRPGIAQSQKVLEEYDTDPGRWISRFYGRPVEWQESASP